MPSDFFTELGKQVAAELGRPSGRYPANPSVRAELANIMGTTLNHHLTRPPPGANDAALANSNSLRSRNMPRGPSYDQDPDNLNPRGTTDPNNGAEPPSAEELVQFVRICLAKMPDAGEALAQLTELVSTAPTNGAGDRAPRGGRRTARDTGLPRNNMNALDRRPAMDSAVRGMNTESFLKRWPDGAKVSLSGTGR